MINIENCSKEELLEIKKIISNKKINKKIDLELTAREKPNYHLQKEYSSSRLPDYNEKYFFLCNELLLEYSITDFPFLFREGFFGCANNKKRDFNFPVVGFTNTKFDDNWKLNLGYIVSIFQNKSFQTYYEGTYNSLNYLINAIYKELTILEGKINSKNDLFIDINSRKEFVKSNFNKIARELWLTRENIFESRLSIGNCGLMKNCNKIGKRFSSSQEMFAEAIAYGCSFDELSNDNYEGAKRLLYIPKDKIRP